MLDDKTQKSLKGFSQGTPRRGFLRQGTNAELRQQTISIASAGDIAPNKLESTEQNIKVAAADEEIDNEEDYLEEQGESGIEEMDRVMFRPDFTKHHVPALTPNLTHHFYLL
ncbi:hypothetical protein LTR17_020079 [Elasticomyces elasticus]|nr:hypothetical protein LTR17_020079 [Elasticomyces elasticus]